MKTKSQGPTAVLRWAVGLARARLGFKPQHQASKQQLTKQPQISIRQAPATPQQPTKPSPFQMNQRGAYSPASHPKSTEQRRCFKVFRAPYREAAGGKRWGSLYHSSQGHLLFLFLGLQHRREGDLKSCLARGADGAEVAENRQTHRADIANLNETSMAEAGSPIVHVDRRWED